MGVFLSLSSVQTTRAGLPHARGGVSSPSSPTLKSAKSSPRTWGCFSRHRLSFIFGLVFPTHVGVFPEDGHGCGVPPRSSPRTWGCFLSPQTKRQIQGVFPTHVGVFLKGEFQLHAGIGLPHARGGVSNCKNSDAEEEKSSPRTWGCFTLGAGLSGFGIVFPTHVGGAPSRGCPRKPLPHSWGFSRLPLT